MQQKTAMGDRAGDAAGGSASEGVDLGRPRRVVACDSAHDGVDDDAPVCVPIATDRFEVSRRGLVVGFIERVGPMYVCLSGPWYSVAIETRQLMSLDAAVALFRRA